MAGVNTERVEAAVVTMDRDGWSADPLGRLISQCTDARRMERQWERRLKRDCHVWVGDTLYWMRHKRVEG